LPVGRLPAGTEIGPGVAMLSLVNWIGLGASLAVGLFLLCGWLRPFEHYKLALAIQFLLVLGIVGDFFFVRQPQHYPWVVAVRLLLLLGLLFLRDDPRPGETRGRIERLGLRSLWILVPLILLFGAPLFASALRFALRDFDFTKWALALLVLLAVLLVEQVALPWHLFTRGSRAERAMSFLLTAAVVALFVGALWWSPAETVGRSEGRRVVAVLVTLPLVVSLLFHLQESGLFTARAAKPELPPAPGRLRTFYDGESLIVRIRRRRRFAAGLPHLVAGGLLLTATWWLSHYVSGAAGLVVLLVLSLFGSALVAVLVLGLVPSYTVQVRNGAARSALVFLGGALGRAAWHRRIRLPALLDATPLGTLEKRWLSRVLDRTEAPPPAEVELSLRLVSSDEGTGVATELTVELEVRNLGETAVRLADLERAAGGPWSAEVAGRRADVHFGRADRERLVGAGDTARFRARLFPTGGASAEKGALLRCGALEARAEAT
jgi:hypothetical protein